MPGGVSREFASLHKRRTPELDVTSRAHRFHIPKFTGREAHASLEPTTESPSLIISVVAEMILCIRQNRGRTLVHPLECIEIRVSENQNVVNKLTTRGTPPAATDVLG